MRRDSVALTARARSDPEVLASFIDSTAVALKRCTHHVHLGVAFFGVEGSDRLVRWVV